ncbi:MAG: hypothetical protein LBD20_07540 [Spirochaetaceae bacterium]|jgi:hypothetical protein|nr:hypothetical protein [Spirochaetaceae bacterium]
MKNPYSCISRVYVILSIIFLIVGFLIYIFFRNTNIIFYTWIGDILSGSVLFNMRYTGALPPCLHVITGSLPDGLWVLSGIMFLRVLWRDNPAKGGGCVWWFCMLAFSLELMQMSERFPGTFDIYDLCFMAAAAAVERVFFQKAGGIWNKPPPFV